MIFGKKIDSAAMPYSGNHILAIEAHNYKLSTIAQDAKIFSIR